MNTNSKLGSVKELALFGRLLRGTLLATAVFALAFVVAPYILAEANAATDVSGRITWSAIDLTLDPDVDATDDAVAAALEAAAAEKESALTEEETAEVTATAKAAAIAAAGHGNVEFGTIIPTATNADAGDYGTLKVEKKTIGVSTRGKYYSVYLSMAGTERALTMDGLETTSMKISPTSGTWDTPKTLAQNGGTGWGYMVPETVVKKSDGTTASVFSTLTRTGVAGTFNGKLDTALYQTSGVAYTASVWAGVPAKSAPQQVWKDTTGAATGFSTQQTFDVYYAVNVDTDVMAGTYQNQVVYTAIASAQSLDSVSTNLARTVKFGATGSVQTIYFDMAQSSLGMIVEDDIKIYMVPHATMAAAHFDPAQLSSEAKTAAQQLPCTVVENSFTTVTTTQAETEGSLSSVRCTMPERVASDDSSGAYDYWLQIDGFGFNYVSKIDNGAESGFVYAGLQTVDGNGNRYVTTMQDMSPGVCANTNIWDNGLGSNAKLYAADGTQIKTVAEGGTLPNDFYSSTAADNIGSFALTDTRDGKRYVVRRLADGNCWMSQNLNLDLYTGMTLTSDDTDINETRGSWTIADADDSNDERVVSAYDDTNYRWIANAGSTSKAWQLGHGVETVTLKQYSYNAVLDDETGNPTGEYEWAGTAVATCENGTAQTPCYAYASASNKYYKLATAADVAASRAANEGDEYEVTAAYALADGYKTNDTTGSPVRGFVAGVYYTKATYEVRKMNAANLGSGNTYSWTTEPTTCSFSYYNDRLKDATACVVETSGATMITQFANANVTIGMNSTVIPRLAITKDHLGNTIDFMNNGADGVISYNDATYLNYPTSAVAADYRWNPKGRDGAHVLDAGPVIFSTNVTNDGTDYTLVSGGGNGAKCGNVGTTQGTLRVNGSVVNFVSCMDGAGNDAKALADTRVDGNWYNWYAAVAGSDISSWTVSAQDSICPKGWKLPKDDETFNASSKPGVSNFYSLIGTNHTTLVSDKSYNINNNTDSNQGSSGVDTKIQAFPLSFLRSGYYRWLSGGLNGRGGNGYYWSAATYNTSYSRYLYFYASSLSPRDGYSKGSGFAVRCVASAQ